MLSDQTQLCFLAGLTDHEAAASAADSQPQHSSNITPDNAQQQPASQALPSQPPNQTNSFSQLAVSPVKSPLHSTDAEAQLQQLVPQPTDPLAVAQSQAQPEVQQEGQHVMNADSRQQDVQNLSCEAHETSILRQPGIADPKQASDNLPHVDAPGRTSPSADEQPQRQQQQQQYQSEPDALAVCEPGFEQQFQGDAQQEQVQDEMVAAPAVHEGHSAQAQVSAAQVSAAEGTHGSTADSDADDNEDNSAEGAMMQEEQEASPAPAEARRSAQPSRRRQAAQRRSSPTPLASRAAGGSSSGRKAAGKRGIGRGRAATPAARAAAVQKPRRSTSRSTAGKRRRSPS